MQAKGRAAAKQQNPRHNSSYCSSSSSLLFAQCCYYSDFLFIFVAMFVGIATIIDAAVVGMQTSLLGLVNVQNTLQI